MLGRFDLLEWSLDPELHAPLASMKATASSGHRHIRRHES